jgi:hypothetical protein
MNNVFETCTHFAVMCRIAPSENGGMAAEFNCLEVQPLTGTARPLTPVETLQVLNQAQAVILANAFKTPEESKPDQAQILRIAEVDRG